MAKRMTVQEVLDEIVADQDSGDFDNESGDIFIANSSALIHIYILYMHIGVVKLRARGQT